jgi:RIO kinase 1
MATGVFSPVAFLLPARSGDDLAGLGDLIPGGRCEWPRVFVSSPVAPFCWLQDRLGQQKGNMTVPKYDPYAKESLPVQDDYEYYEGLFDPMRTDRLARRRRKPVPVHIPKVLESDAIDGLAESAGADAIELEGGFKTTYRPGRHEAQWLLDSLRGFYHGALITDVLAQIKGGKEASVYCCEAHPSIGVPYLAAKVYRPRRFRTMRNDVRYRRGRQVLTGDGRPVKKTDHRVMRAIGKKTAFGVQVMHTSWLMHEYTTMKRLYKAGAAVPRPVGSSENSILMGYYGDGVRGAPTLNEVSLDRDEAEVLFREVLRNVELFLAHELIHGDLSAYNILYWGGAITVIDFPQVVECATNREAYSILRRDLERVCDYFERQGVRSDSAALLDSLWRRYVEDEDMASHRAAEMSVMALLVEEERPI